MGEDQGISQDEIDKLLGITSTPSAPEPAAMSSAASAAPERVKVPSPPAATAEFAPVQSSRSSLPPKEIDFILDIPVKITAQLGKTSMLLKDVLQVGPGTVIELDRLAGETVDILVNDKLIAKGEVVVINENFGVRLTEIVNPVDRINKLK